MSRENYLESFIAQSKEDIHEIYLESERDGEFRPDIFNAKLPRVWLSARDNGMSEDEFSEIVADVVHVNMEVVELPYMLKKVA